ncbi:MAG: hypothetical protein KKB25_00245 [Nanoarchaeota archaeon]|nr:hypothetical protein [Nanoarchaeota archaeon]
MRLEKHEEGLKEVLSEIESALEDAGGLVNHQRRLAMMLSLGVCELIEIYFHKIGIMKGGARIKHGMFRKSNMEELLSNQITAPLKSVKNMERILEIAVSIENNRDDMAYGSPLNEEELLKEKIDEFLEMKKLIENETK